MSFGKLQVDQIESSTRLYNVDEVVTLDNLSEVTASILEQFRESRKIYVSLEGDDENNGTSAAEPLRTLKAASLLAEPGDVVFIAPGTYIEETLPIRWKYDVTIFGSGLRSTIVQPAPGQEFNDIFKVDSGFWCWGISFAGHQADETRQAWAIDFDELADNRHRGAISLGAHIFKSPYIQNCTSITAEDDKGLAGSNSTGNTGGGIRVDGSKCSINTPIRSMVVDSYTQVNLGGPGCLVLNDGYAQLVSFFGTFCTYHVRTETGGQVNLSGGGTTDFGLYGLMADGYSPFPLFTGSARTKAFGSTRLEKTFTVDLDTNTFFCVDHELVVNDQVTVRATQGNLPTGLESNTNYFVVSTGLTSDTFQLSLSEGSTPLEISGTATGTYQLLRQGVTEIDVIDLSSNRLGRQIKYPVQGGAGSSGNPVSVFSIDIDRFFVTLDTSDIVHEYVGGGIVSYGGEEYEVTSAVYDNSSGITVLTAAGYIPKVGDSISLSGLSFICNSSSRPNAGQLMFPQIVFPRDSSTGLPEAKTFNYTRTGLFTLTYLEDSAPDGPDYEYVSGGTATIGDTSYKIIDADYNKTTGLVTVTTSSQLPLGDGDVTVEGIHFVSPNITYVINSSIPIDTDGNEVENTDPSRAGYRVVFYSGLNGGLKETIYLGQTLDFRNRSQISAPSHTFEFVGSGMNYDALPWNGGVPVEGNAIIETNNGRVYSSNTNEKGDFKVGSQFTVDGTSGSVTINTDQFNLSGVNFIGPFSRNGGISTVGEQLREVSNNTSLIASIGGPDSNTVPSQFAVKTYTDNKFLIDVTVSENLPLTITDTSEQDNQGYWTRKRNIELSINEPDGLARLDGSGLVPSSLLPSYVDDVLEFADFDSLPETGETGKIYVALDNGKTYRWGGSAYVEISSRPPSTDEVPEGLTNLYFTESRSRASLSVTGSNGLEYDSESGSLSFTFPDTGVVPDTYNLATLTVDSKGRITFAESGTISLNDNTDVDLSTNSPTNKQSLLYDEVTGKWSPANVVTSIGFTAPTGFSVSGSPVTTSGTIELTFSEGYSLPTNTSQSNWDTAYSERLYWDGGSTGLNATTARTSLGLGNSATLNVGTTSGTVAAGDSLGIHVADSDPHPGYALESSLATVATSGAYGDLSGTPTFVSSVALTAPPGFSVSGSPITTSGTITLSYAAGYQGYTSTEASKLAGIAAGAEVNVNADWNATSGDAQILNKPTLGGAAALDVGTTSSTVAAGDRGLPTGGTPGQALIKSSGTDYDADWETLTTADIYVIVCSDETTALTTGTGKVTFRMPSAGTLTAVKATVTTAPVGSALVVDINEAGTTLLSTKLSIDDGEKTSSTAATPAVISDSALANDAEITIDIDQVGSGTAGAGLKVTLYVTRG